MKRRRFLYLTKKGFLLCVFSKKRPNIDNIPKSGTWVVNEYIKGEWQMPCFPEIVWETLKQFKYVGELAPKE